MRKNPIKLDRIERKRMEQFANYWTDSNSYKAKVILPKIKVILMRDDNRSIDYIIKETGLSKRTIINYTNAYLKDNRFFAVSKKKCQSILEIKNVKSIFTGEEPPMSYREAKDRIKEKFKIDISIIQVRHYLNRNGIFTARSNHKLNFYAKRKLNKSVKEKKEKIVQSKLSNH